MVDTLAAALEAWWCACLARPGELPKGVQPVQGRLVRRVGVGETQGGTRAFLKLMAFPRAKDKLRYVHRALPARHEATLLARLPTLGIPAPEVLLARTARRFGLPHLSLLVTKALPIADDQVLEARFPEVAALAARLAAAGIDHHDLNRGNFVALRDGGLAVLDLQSARDHGAPLSLEPRLRMASKLLDAFGATLHHAEALRTSGLVPGTVAAEELVARAAAVRAKEVTKRIVRCLLESTEFTCQVRPSGILHRRRTCDLAGPEGTWIEGGRELLRWWIGDRANEVLGHGSPRIGALFRNSCWLLQRGRLYIPGPSGHAVLRDHVQALEQGYARYREMKRPRLRRSEPSSVTTASSSSPWPVPPGKPTSRS